jgi:hypothetical protein
MRRSAGSSLSNRHRATDLSPRATRPPPSASARRFTRQPRQSPPQRRQLPPRSILNLQLCLKPTPIRSRGDLTVTGGQAKLTHSHINAHRAPLTTNKDTDKKPAFQQNSRGSSSSNPRPAAEFSTRAIPPAVFPSLRRPTRHPNCAIWLFTPR